MAVVGSNGVGWKVSSFTKSDCGDWDCWAAEEDLRPVMESQLLIVSNAGEECIEGGRGVHCHLEDVKV